MYAGTAHPYDGSNSERVYKSTDGGATWSQTSLDAKGFTVDAIAVNPAKSSQVIAVSAGVIGYFQSLDAGKTWSSIGTDTKCGSVNSVLFDSAGATILMAGGAGFCSSADGGKTWTLAPMPDNSPLTALLIDPSVPTTIYAGAAPFFTGGPGGGVFRSTDGGQTWSTLGTGLDGAYVTGLVLSAQTLHAGIYGGSVAELALVPSRATVTPPSSSPRRTRTRSPR